MEGETQPSLQGLRIVSFESRRAPEIAELIRRYGGEPIIAPSLREVPLSENRAAFDFVRRLEGRQIDIVVFLTGVGTRALIEAVRDEWPAEKLAALLKETTLVARGPKPVAALRDIGLEPSITIPEPNTWREILAVLDAALPVRGRRVAVQEYGVTNRDFLAGLEGRGAEVLRVPVYRWALPEDTGPLRAAVRAILDGRVDIALFTNATQVIHLFQVSTEEASSEALSQACGRLVVASIGPVCSEMLEQFGLRVDIEPEHPKMGHLIAAVASRGPTLVKARRATVA